MMEREMDILTAVARAGYADHGLGAWRIFEDLSEERFASLLSVFVGGPRLEEEACRILDRLMTIYAVADPRIWPLKITRLVASYGRVMPGLAAGQVFLSKAPIGPIVPGLVARQFLDLSRELDNTLSPGALEAVLEERFAHKEPLLGWGVPGRAVDERHKELTDWYEKFGFVDRSFWKLLVAMQEYVARLKGLTPNIAASTAAILLDLGYAPRQIEGLMVAFLHGNFLANALEGAQQQAILLQRLPDEVVSYRGPEFRWSNRRSEALSRGAPSRHAPLEDGEVE